MEEAGFASVRILVLPRNDVDSANGTDAQEDDYASDMEEGDLVHLILRTERQEKQRRTFHTLQPGEKVFTTRSFATYIVAKAP